MSLKVGINGFGRIGRQVFRIAFDNDNIEFVGINDVVETEQLSHLIKYDSAHGTWDKQVDYEEDGIIVDGEKYPTFSIKDPADLPWDRLDVDIVVESTGMFRKKDSAKKHLEAGASKVLLSAPYKGDKPVLTIVYGVNEEDYDRNNHDIVSNASCTTNGFAPIVKVLDDEFGIEKGLMTTTHSYTVSQNILDGPNKKDLRRARACAVSMIPTTTGAAKAVNLVLPEMEGKLDAMAVRVPTQDGSLVDFTAHLSQDVTKEDIDHAMKEAAEGEMDGVLQYITDPVVSVDIVGNPHSSIYDEDLTRVIGDDLVKVFAWYDNETGFAARMIDVLEMML